MRHMSKVFTGTQPLLDNAMANYTHWKNLQQQQQPAAAAGAAAAPPATAAAAAQHQSGARPSTDAVGGR